MLRFHEITTKGFLSLPVVHKLLVVGFVLNFLLKPRLTQNFAIEHKIIISLAM